MRDLASPLLTPRVVSDLTGLSPQVLRQWEAFGIPSATGSNAARNRPRLYSWRDVEQLQQASYLMMRGSVSMAAVGRVLAQNAAAEFDRPWIVARRNPGKTRQARPRTRSRRKRRVVVVALPRSARRRSRREQTAQAARRHEGTLP